MRERTRRLRDVRLLSEQVRRVRRVGLRGEVLVPVVALLILAVTLGLSALAPTPGDVAMIDPLPSPTAPASSTPAMVSSLTQTSPAGYPLGGSEPATSTAVMPPQIEPSEVITPTDSIYGDPSAMGPGYPGPSVPEGVGPPPSGGGLPTSGDSSIPPPVTIPDSVPQVPPPVLIPTAPPDLSENSGYPPPATSRPQAPVSQPQAPSQPDPPQSDPVPSSDYPVPEGTPGTPVPAEEAIATPSSEPTPGLTPAPGLTPTPASPTPTPLPPTATARPAKALSGNVHWTTANSPILLTEDHLVAPGALLTIDPGVEVQLAPDVRLAVAGTLRAGGNTSAPVRMVGLGGRWDGLVGVEGSTIMLDGVELRQAGRNGTAVSTTGGTLVMHNALLTDSGGGITALRSVVDLRRTQITGNSIAGPAVNILLPSKAGTAIAGNIIGGNGSTPGAPQILITGEEAPGTFTFEGNHIIGGAGPGAVVNTAAPVTGTIRCNSFAQGTIGLQLSTKRPDLNGFNLAIDTNAFTGQSRFGAAGSLPFNLANNWWGNPTGPMEAQRNPQGRGVPVGVTLQFHPWLAEHPACAPR